MLSHLHTAVAACIYYNIHNPYIKDFDVYLLIQGLSVDKTYLFKFLSASDKAGLPGPTKNCYS